MSPARCAKLGQTVLATLSRRMSLQHQQPLAHGASLPPRLTIFTTCSGISYRQPLSAALNATVHTSTTRFREPRNRRSLSRGKMDVPIPAIPPITTTQLPPVRRAVAIRVCSADAQTDAAQQLPI